MGSALWRILGIGALRAVWEFGGVRVWVWVIVAGGLGVIFREFVRVTAGCCVWL